MKYTKEYLTKLVNDSKSMWDVIEKTGMSKQEGNYSYINRLIEKYDINKSHFDNQRNNKSTKEKPLEEYLVNGKYLTISGNIFKEKLFKANLKQPICEKCGQDEYWKGEKISLILDHINGDRYNNLLENLRIVCPNCNATLPTHGGKNRRNKNTCEEAGARRCS